MTVRALVFDESFWRNLGALAMSFVLPFRWAFGFPIEVIIGPISDGELAAGLAMQAAWLAALVVLIRVVWRRGVRRFAAVGG